LGREGVGLIPLGREGVGLIPLGREGVGGPSIHSLKLEY
jgi:hypothetical protein